MTVRELLKELEGVDGGREVVLSKDSEGNQYSPAACCDVAKCREDGCTWFYEVDHPDESPWPEGEGRPAFVLWPAC